MFESKSKMFEFCYVLFVVFLLFGLLIHGNMENSFVISETIDNTYL